MKVHFFNRYYYPSQISIEKLFSVLKLAMEKKDLEIKEFTNPYLLNIKGIIKALFYFKKNQGKINHITGDITWSSFLLKGKSLIITIHDLGGMRDLKGLKQKIFFIWWIYLPIRKAKFVTVISNSTRNEILHYMPSAAGKIKVIHNCFTMQTDPDFRREWNRIPKILIVGTRINKNVENMLRALEKIECSLNIVGNLSESHKELLQTLHITYTNYGFLDNSSLEGLYKNSDILAFVSTYEGFGLPILEANAFQCCVITSNIEPLTEVAGNSAHFVDPYSISSIRNGFLELIQNDILKDQLVANGKKNLKRFDAEIIAQEYIDLYNQF